MALKPLASASSVTARSAYLPFILFGLLVLGLPLLFGTAAKIFNDGDTSWHLAAGQWILEHRQIPRVDPFSHTMAGQPWVAHEWLCEILLAGAYQAAGFAGIAALVTLALTMLHLIVYRRAGPPIAPAVTYFTFIGLVLVLGPFTVARPHVLVWPLMALWTSLLLDASDAGRPPPRWLPLLMILWVNLHGSFLLGLIIYGAIATDALLSRRPGFAQWFVIGIASAAATLVNANGVETLLFPFTVSQMETLHLIQEWRPSRIDTKPFFFLVAAVVIGATVWNWKRTPPMRMLLLLFLLGMALLHVRHQTWFAIAAALIVPRGFAAPSIEKRESLRPAISPRAAFAAAFLPALLALFLPIRPNEGASYPAGLLAAVPPELRSRPVFNEYGFGGPLILAGVRPFIDGRADMYGDAFFKEYSRIEGGDFARFTKAADRYGIQWTMMQNADKRLIAALDASPDWRRHASDKVGVIHVRRAAPAR